MVEEVKQIIQEVSFIQHYVKIHSQFQPSGLFHIMRTLLQSVESVLGAAAYQNNKVNQWTSSVVEQCLNQLTKLGKPFKYIGELRDIVDSRTD